MRDSYKKIVFFLIFISSGFCSLAQDFGYEWIDFNQKYYKVKTADEGLYKITYELLKQSNVDSVFFHSNSKLQLWHRGIQQAISIKSSGDSLKSGDYIVFYGIKNNGELDADLYYPATNLYNPYASLFSDTTAYFLTVSESSASKRMDTLASNNFSNPSNYFLTETVQNYFDYYWNVGRAGEHPIETFFTPGEGWCGLSYYHGTETVPINQYVNTDSVIIEFYSAGKNEYPYSPKTCLLGNNTSDSLFFPFYVDSVSSIFGAIKTQLTLSNTDLNSYIKDGYIRIHTDYVWTLSVNYIRIKYPQKATLKSVAKAGFYTSGKNSQSLQITDVSPGSYFILSTDRNSTSWINAVTKGDTTYLPNISQASKLFYSTSLESITSISPVIFRQYSVSDSTYLILTHNNLMSSAKAYAEYRKSQAGGAFDTLLTEIHQITDQFSYGERSPAAIRRFLNHLKSKNINAPDHFFIIGMGIQLDQMQPERKNESLPDDIGDLVIPAGCPAGDFVYAIGLNGNSATNHIQNIPNRYPTVPTGRLSARTNTEVLNYLSKAKEQDALGLDATWRRNVLHISGGYNASNDVATNKAQSLLFKAYLDGCASIISQPFFGADVQSYGRYLSGPTELVDVSAEVNKGVSMITFLGHSSESITDVSIGYVSDGYNTFGFANKGKYPMLYLNGCIVGNTFYDYGPITGNNNLILDWILTKDRGAIIGLSNTGTGFDLDLKSNIENTYISSFLDSTNFAKSIGDQIKIAQKRYLDNKNPINPDLHTSALMQTMTIQGDPAIKIFNAPKPDFETVCERVSLSSYSNLKITSQSDSFAILIPIRNYGMYIRSKVAISVKRSYSNNTKSIQYPPVYYLPIRELDTLTFKIQGKIPDAFGANVFEIQIDPENQISELNETNNTCQYTAYIPGNSLSCLYPKKYSIVGKQPISFIAESYTITTAERDYYFELDTNYRFNSFFKRSATVKAFNTPIWDAQSLLDNVPQNDSIVYYWRVRYAQAQANEDTSYSYSSFIYIKDSPEGWSQSKYPQFFEDEARAIKMDSTEGKWSFQKLSANIKFTTTGSDNGSDSSIRASLVSTFLSFKNIPLIFPKMQGGQPTSVCERSGLYLLTINPYDLTIRLAAPDPNTEPYPPVYYICDQYLSPSVTRFIPEIPGISNRIYDVLKNNVKEGEIIALLNMGKVNGFFPLPDSLNQILKTFYGASIKIDSIKDGQPYLLLARKGFGKIIEKTPISPFPYKETLTIDTTIYSLGYGGYISSTVIGPATEWGSFFRGYQKENTDSLRFDILGIDSAGNETIVAPDVKEDNFPLKDLVNANSFPFLRLNAYAETQTANTPQLIRWQVIYRPAPEGTLVISEQSGNDYASFSKQEGDTSKTLKFTFKNISNESFLPNLLVRYRITNDNKIIDYYDTLRTSLSPDSSWISSFRINTLGLGGNNVLEVFFNPPPFSQKEQFLENNRYTINFTIDLDKIHPVLDVAFDGQRIMNGDIVLPSPTISVAVNDENKYLIRKDTTGITVELQKPCGQNNCPFEKVYLGGNDVTVYPAGASNKFELRYKPEKLPDGVYTLRVQAKDLSGNASGTKPYTIQFEVVNEVAITNFLPYPNPFSSRMWFVYTLTGDLPDQLRIQILTVTGKVVKQIFMEELGPLRIGTHRTDFIWDGTDDYGDQLANGLYIYHVSARKGGEELKHRNTATDNLFKNGYGKLYILR